VWAYRLTSGIYYPSPSISYQVGFAAKTSILTALLSAVTWVVPVIRARCIGYVKAALIVGLGTQVLLTLRSVLSLYFDGLPYSPSTMFAEYNWLTFILEVGPIVSLASVLLTIGVMWIAKRPPLPNDQLS
jgi:hypothetical protein